MVPRVTGLTRVCCIPFVYSVLPTRVNFRGKSADFRRSNFIIFWKLRKRPFKWCHSYNIWEKVFGHTMDYIPWSMVQGQIIWRRQNFGFYTYHLKGLFLSFRHWINCTKVMAVQTPRFVRLIIAQLWPRRTVGFTCETSFLSKLSENHGHWINGTKFKMVP